MLSSTNWDGLFEYAYPPAILIPKVPQLQNPPDRSVTTQQTLVSGATGLARRLANSTASTVGSVEAASSRSASPHQLALHAWMLSNDHSAQRDFLMKCPLGSPDQIEHLLWRFTSQSGKSYVLGVRERQQTDPFILNAPLISDFLLEKYQEGRAPSTQLPRWSALDRA